MFGLGTDSNINISLVEEIKTFEYSQRLINKKRAVISNKNKSNEDEDSDDSIPELESPPASNKATSFEDLEEILFAKTQPAEPAPIII